MSESRNGQEYIPNPFSPQASWLMCRPRSAVLPSQKHRNKVTALTRLSTVGLYGVPATPGNGRGVALGVSRDSLRSICVMWEPKKSHGGLTGTTSETQQGRKELSTRPKGSPWLGASGTRQAGHTGRRKRRSYGQSISNHPTKRRERERQNDVLWA